MTRRTDPRLAIGLAMAMLTVGLAAVAPTASADLCVDDVTNAQKDDSCVPDPRDVIKDPPVRVKDWPEGPQVPVEVYGEPPEEIPGHDVVVVGQVEVEFPNGVTNELFGLGQNSPCEAYNALGIPCNPLTKDAAGIDVGQTAQDFLDPVGEPTLCLSSQQLGIDRDGDGTDDNNVPLPFSKATPVFTGCV